MSLFDGILPYKAGSTNNNSDLLVTQIKVLFTSFLCHSQEYKLQNFKVTCPRQLIQWCDLFSNLFVCPYPPLPSLSLFLSLCLSHSLSICHFRSVSLSINSLLGSVEPVLETWSDLTCLKFRPRQRPQSPFSSYQSGLKPVSKSSGRYCPYSSVKPCQMAVILNAPRNNYLIILIIKNGTSVDCDLPRSLCKAVTLT